MKLTRQEISEAISIEAPEVPFTMPFFLAAELAKECRRQGLKDLEYGDEHQKVTVKIMSKPVVRPSLEGPFYALESKNVDTGKMECLVVTDAKAVCHGNFSVLTQCNNWQDAVFVAFACNEALELPGVRFVTPQPKKINWHDVSIDNDL
jgi:hypothetical protein